MPAQVDISCDRGVTLPMSADDVARVVETVLDAEGVSRGCLVSVSAVSDERMRALNAAWRGVDAPTDVLSLECERPDDPDLAAGEPCELGDIVLAPHVIAGQAARFSTTVQAECALLLIHGLLHLLGYDHLTDADANVMEAREDELLVRVLGREATHVGITRHHGDGGVQA